MNSRFSKVSEAAAPAPLPTPESPWDWLQAFWKFSRPHTIVGTTLSVLGIAAMAIAAQSPISGINGLGTLLACWCGNVYIVGLNQLEDVAIDRINKPHLPLASGEFSRWQARSIVLVAGVLALVLAAWQSSYLLATVGLSIIIGTLYSLPPIRLKRFPFWAALCIFTVRGAIVNLGLWLHFTNGNAIPPQVWALTLFIVLFTVAIALFKDIPDTAGDRQYQIMTFTLKLGQQHVFNITRWIVTACYLGMILAGMAGLPGVDRWLLVTTHGLALVAFWWHSQSVGLQDKACVQRFYQFIWKLFFLEYLLVPLGCWLSSSLG